MRHLMDRVFAHYGMHAVLESGGSKKTVRVFFHSVNSRSWQNMERMFLPLGEIPRGQYICVLPAGTAAVGDILHIGMKAYLICRAEEMALRAGSIYQWALCEEKGGQDTWGLTE